MIRLRRLELKGYKTLRDIVFEPGQITVLIGENGAGKSNLLSFFRLLSHIMGGTGSLQLHVGKWGLASAFLTDGTKYTREIAASVSIETESGTNDYSFKLSLLPPDRLLISDEHFRFVPAGAPGPHVWTALPPGIQESALLPAAESGGKTAKVIRDLLRSIALHQFHDTSRESRLRQSFAVEDNWMLKEDAGNLAPVLMRLSQDSPGCYQEVLVGVRSIAPYFEEFVFIPNQGHVLLQWTEKGTDAVFNASQAADGFLRCVSLVTLLTLPPERRPKVVLIDEPELGLHPTAVGLVASLLHRASRHTQFIVATQSVEFLRRFDEQSVLVVERPGRYTTLSRPDPSVLGQWLGESHEREYDIGDLWLKNAIGGKP